MRVDLTHDTKDDLEGIRLPAGYYLTTCIGHHKGAEREEVIWTFRIESTLFHGQNIESKLGNPEVAQSDEEAKGQWARLKKWLKRLGILSDADIGKNVDLNMAGCVGKRFVIQLADNWFVGKNGDRVNIPRPAYLGVYGPDHPEIPPAERVKLGLPLLPGQTVDSAGAPADGKPAKAPRKGGAKASAEAPAAAAVPYDVNDI